MEDLLRFKFNQKYINFDVETEGLNLVSSRPWQISWIEAVGKKITVRKNKFIWWDDLDISNGAAIVTRFDKKYYFDEGSQNKTYRIDGKVFKTESPLSVYSEIINKLNQKDFIIVGQNILGYDIYILGVLAKKLGLKIDYSFVNRIFDTKAVAMALAKENKTPDKEDFLSWQIKFLNHRERKIKTNQKFLLQKYEINFEESKLHDGIYDVEKNFEIFQKQIWELDI